MYDIGLTITVFANYFATIDSMLSRSRELRADWISATIYGSQNFSSALTKVVQIGSHFGEHVEDIALDGDVDFFEEYSRVLHSSSSKLEEYLNKAFVETEQDFDTHPTISTRIKSLPANEVVEGDESLMGSAKEELLGDEKRLSTEYLGYIKTIKEMHDNRGGGDLPIHENWLAITQDIATGMEEVRKDWFTTCVKILQDRPPEEDAILTKSEVTNVHLGGEAELAAKAYQLRLASDYLALHEYIPPHEGQDFADILYSQVCGKQFKKCLPYLSCYNEVWSDSGGKRYFRFFIDVAKYITDCEAPAPEAMDIAKTHLTFAFANHIVVASAFGDVKTVKELQEKMKSESSGSLGNGGKRIMGDTVKEWVKKGDTLVTSGMYEEAIECCDKALEIDPGVGPAWYNKGVALTRLEKYEDAIGCYDKALEINPDLEIAKKYRTLAETKLGEQESRIPTTPPNQINRNMAEEQFSNGGSLATSGRYGGAKTMNIGMNLEIHFHQQDEASVYLESDASGKDEKFGEILLFCCFALRTMSNFGRHSIASSLATMLSQIGDHLIELPNLHSPDEAKLVSYQGNQGRKRFVAKLRYNDKNFTFKFKPKGLFLTGGIDYYAPNSVMILLRYLVEKRIDDEAFISSLSQATKKCGEAYIGRQISMWTHNRTALTIASSVTEMG